MTPELLDDGARRLAEYKAKQSNAESTSQSGGQAASFSRLIDSQTVDLAGGGILYVEDITVSFDGFRALNKLSLDIRVGELRCIIGPNGAGKTTMMDVITGKTRPDSGRATFGSNIDLLRLRESEIAERGIGRKFQKPTVFEQLTVFENLELAAKTDRRVRHTLFAKLTLRELDQLNDTMNLIHLAGDGARIAGNLSHGQKQWLEIGMLLMQNPKLLLLDEPVAGMTDEETERTAELFLSLEGTHSLIVVEHDMKFIGELINGGQQTKKKVVTVLHEGSVLAEGSLTDVQNDERVIEVYLGR
jgi:urea transport system ATP-binding protein